MSRTATEQPESSWPAACPGAGAYGNHVTGNTANDNGLAGISVHSHTPFQDMNGNIITNNTTRPRRDTRAALGRRPGRQ